MPEVTLELYSFKTTIKCKEIVERDCKFENKVKTQFKQLIKVLKILNKAGTLISRNYLIALPVSNLFGQSLATFHIVACFQLLMFPKLPKLFKKWKVS